MHNHTGAFGDHGHLICLEVFLRGGLDERAGVFRRDDHGHAFLRFGDRKLGAVQTLVLFAHLVQINLQSVCQLADGDADAARAKIVAALDHTGDIAVAEQALNLALLGGVALLHLGGHGAERFLVVALGRTGRAADAVAARAAAKQNHNVTGHRTLTHNVFCRSRADGCADLKMLGDVAGMIDFGHLTGSKADLVAVGGVTGGSRLRQLALGQLAGDGFRYRRARIAAARHAHGLIDIRAARERITDAAANTGGSAAEGFNLGGMVVRLVLEHEEPVLRLAVNSGADVNGAGVDFLALIEVF